VLGEQPRTRARAATTWRKAVFWSAFAIVPAGVASLASRRSRLTGAIAGGLTAAALGAFRHQLQRWFSEEPAFEVERRVDRLEIRRYSPRVEARTEIPTDDHDRALEAGFHVLADYLAGEHLPMTSPVISQHAGHHHSMGFVMPPGRTLDSLPEPQDARVHLDEIPARRVAVLPYRGRYNAKAVALKQQELLERVRAAGFAPVGEPAFAGFDPPNTLPWLRRNEVWVDLAPAS
jgi:hypothetical protein